MMQSGGSVTKLARGCEPPAQHGVLCAGYSADRGCLLEAGMTRQRIMQRAGCSVSRRRLLGAGLALAGGWLLPAPARAGRLMGLSGEVRVNGRRVSEGAAVLPGDLVETGVNGDAVFVIGEDAFRLRAGSEMDLYGARGANGGVVSGLRLLSGALLAVFGPGRRDVLTATAVAGIRGTGIYLEASAEHTYFCTCYGEVDLADQHRQQRVRVASHYHQPHMIYAAMREGRMMEPSGVKNHSDEELVYLESLVGRVPAFGKG